MNFYLPLLFTIQSPVAPRQGVGFIPPSTLPTTTTSIPPPSTSFPRQQQTNNNFYLPFQNQRPSQQQQNNNNFYLPFQNQRPSQQRQNNNNFYLPFQNQRPSQSRPGRRQFQRPRPTRTRRPLSFEFVPTRIPPRHLPSVPPKGRGQIPIREFLRFGSSSIVAGCHVSRRVPCTTSLISRSTCERWRCCWNASDPVPCSQNTFFITRLEGDDFATCGTPFDNIPSIPAAPPLPPLILNIINPRIIGGVEATPGEWPWMVYVYTLNPSDPDGGIRRRGICGGSLVTERWVISAAHCFETLRASLYGLVLGAHTISQLTGEEEIRTLSRLHIPSIYDGLSFNFDIALLEMNEPVVFNRLIRPICIVPLGTPTDDSLTPSFAGSNCTVLGWGAISQNPDVQADTLMRLDVLITPRPICIIQVASAPTDDYNDRIVEPSDPKFCAGGEDMRDSCSGDSGGPLFCLHDDGRYYLHGIVSYGPATCGQPNKPGVYTKIAHPGVAGEIITQIFS